MSTTITDRHGDTTTVERHEFNTMEAGVELMSDDKDMFFNVPEAIALADAISEAAGVIKREGVRASDVTPNEALVRVAAAHGLAVEFRYSKSDHDPVEFRSLVPESLRTTADGNVVFTGQDPDRDNDIRSYRVDRIKGFVAVRA